MNVVTKNVALPDGRVITIETGKLAKQADGAVMLRSAASPVASQSARVRHRIMKSLHAVWLTALCVLSSPIITTPRFT